MLGFHQYVGLAAEFLELLWPQTVVQRISADCPREFLLGPEWMLEKGRVLEGIDNTLLEKDTFQGSLYKNSS